MKTYVTLGGPGDVDAALSVFERSNLARRRGVWPSRASRLEHVRGNLEDADSWFLIGRDDGEAVAMALVLPFRTDDGAGPVIPETSFLDLIYVLPARWGEGIGGTMLDAAIDEAARRGSHRLFLWTHERENERARRLYGSRGFAPTGRTRQDETGEPTDEWLRTLASTSESGTLSRTERDPTLLSLTALAVVLAIGHHVDHAVRGNHVGWPLTAEVNAFTFSLGIYPAIAIGLILYFAGRVGPGFWAFLSGGGAAFLAFVHFGPQAIEPPEDIIGAHASPVLGWLAFGWLLALVAVLLVTFAYELHRWLGLRRADG